MSEKRTQAANPNNQRLLQLFQSTLSDLWARKLRTGEFGTVCLKVTVRDGIIQSIDDESVSVLR